MDSQEWVGKKGGNGDRPGPKYVVYMSESFKLVIKNGILNLIQTCSKDSITKFTVPAHLRVPLAMNFEFTYYPSLFSRKKS